MCRTTWIIPFHSMPFHHIQITFCLFISFPFLTIILLLSPCRFAKTLRIFLIIKSGLRRIKVTATHVLSFTAFWYAAWLLYLLFISIFAGPIVLDTVTVSLTGQATSQFTCSSQSPAMMTVLYAFEGAFLAGSGYLCYATKNVPDAINEAKVVALGERERELFFSSHLISFYFIAYFLSTRKSSLRTRQTSLDSKSSLILNTALYYLSRYHIN